LLQYLENSKDIDLVQSKKLNLALVEKINTWNKIGLIKYTRCCQHTAMC
jgi:hypothetical protein